MQDLQHEELTIRVEKEPQKVRLIWLGKSTSRTPGTFLLPFFEEVIHELKDQKTPIDNDLTRLEHLNSSTLAAMIGIMRIVRQHEVPMRVLYDPMVGWQERSIDALRVLETPQSVVTFEAASHAR